MKVLLTIALAAFLLVTNLSPAFAKYGRHCPRRSATQPWFNNADEFAMFINETLNLTGNDQQIVCVGNLHIIEFPSIDSMTRATFQVNMDYVAAVEVDQIVRTFGDNTSAACGYRVLPGQAMEVTWAAYVDEHHDVIERNAPLHTAACLPGQAYANLAPRVEHIARLIAEAATQFQAATTVLYEEPQTSVNGASRRESTTRIRHVYNEAALQATRTTLRTLAAYLGLPRR